MHFCTEIENTVIYCLTQDEIWESFISSIDGGNVTE